MRDKTAPARLRVPLDAGARHGRGRAAPDHRSASRARRTASTSTAASSRSSCAKASRSATTTSRRSPSSAPITTTRRDRLRALFGHLPCEFHVTTVRAAEMVKYCCNNFHALKITFANETARLCEALGVDPFEVMDLVCQDTQLNISPAYLKPGFAFGGSCLPKDLRATHLSRQEARRRAADARRHPAVEPGPHRARHRTRCWPPARAGRHDRPVVQDRHRRSAREPLVTLAEHFIGKGMQLLVYDPEVHLSRLLGANRRFIEQHVPHLGDLMREDISEVLAECDVLVVGLATKEIFAALEQHVTEKHYLLDLVGLPDSVALRSRTEGLCW